MKPNRRQTRDRKKDVETTQPFRKKRKRRCKWCMEKVTHIDYKNIQRLRREFLDEKRGKILARRQTGTCAKHQRMLTIAIKRARFMGLLPYVTA